MIPRKRAKPRQLGIAAQVAGVKPVKRKTKYARRKRWPKYLAWLRTQPCSISECHPGEHIVDAAHVGPKPAGYRKCDDRMAIPLHRWLHTQGPYAHHTLTAPGQFERVHNINLRTLWLKYNAEYAAIDPDFVPLEAK